MMASRLCWGMAVFCLAASAIGCTDGEAQSPESGETKAAGTNGLTFYGVDTGYRSDGERE
jgi:hypothetical protein